MENNKKIIITVLSVLVVAMAVGYALLAQELTINGTATIDSTWDVKITGIAQSGEAVGGATSKASPTFTSTTANFSVSLIQPGDSISYNVTVTNSGTLDAIVDSITISDSTNPAINYTVTGITEGTTLAKNGGTNTLTVTVDYEDSIESQPAVTTEDLTVTINYVQDL